MAAAVQVVSQDLYVNTQAEASREDSFKKKPCSFSSRLNFLNSP